MNYKQALEYLMRGVTLENSEIAPNKKFKFDHKTHGIKTWKDDYKSAIIIGPTEFADLSRTTNNWKITE